MVTYEALSKGRTMNATIETAKIDLDKMTHTALLERVLSVPGEVSTAYTRFYPYSLTNQILLWIQGASGPVATYKRWSDMGRQVKRGSKAYKIWRPITVKVDKDDPDSPTFTRFKLVPCVFDIGQTEGEDLEIPEVPEWSKELALERLDIRLVDFDELNGNIQGYARQRQVAINPVAVNPLKTLLHELGHIVAGHTTAPEDKKPSREIAEFQAETIAVIALHNLGLLTEDQEAESRDYVQSWLSGDHAPSEREVSTVFKAVDVILAAGR